jgi:hypothetical protein
LVTQFSQYLIPIIETLMEVLGGILDFIVGVFTGDWEKAWDGIQRVFKGIWDGVRNIAKGAINFIIDVINGAIGAINGLAGGISDLTGGAIDIRIPKIPRLAEGGIITARPGGVLATIGEGRYDEGVLPLAGPRFERFTDDVARKVDDDRPMRIDRESIDELARAVAGYLRVQTRMGVA